MLAFFSIHALMLLYIHIANRYCNDMGSALVKCLNGIVMN